MSPMLQHRSDLELRPPRRNCGHSERRKPPWVRRVRDVIIIRALNKSETTGSTQFPPNVAARSCSSTPDRPGDTVYLAALPTSAPGDFSFGLIAQRQCAAADVPRVRERTRRDREHWLANLVAPFDDDDVVLLQQTGDRHSAMSCS
jgi:hypothetical protein